MNTHTQDEVKYLKNDEAVNNFINDIQCCSLLNLRESFTEKLTRLLTLHLSDITFSVAKLSRLISISERQLQRKVIKSFGLTPKCLIKEVRLNKAIVIIQKTHMSITETSLAVGFSSPAYFSFCFKKRYGVTPTFYKSQSVSNTN